MRSMVAILRSDDAAPPTARRGLRCSVLALSAKPAHKFASFCSVRTRADLDEEKARAAPRLGRIEASPQRRFSSFVIRKAALKSDDTAFMLYSGS